MKILIYGDLHWSVYSSIVRSRGTQYSNRLSRLIDSVNWAEDLAVDKSCDLVVGLGDFFDKPDLTSEEITALTSLRMSNIPHYFLVGNHESNVNGLYYNSTYSLLGVNSDVDYNIIDKTTSIEVDDTSLYFLPYMLEEDRLSFSDYINHKDTNKKIVFSHNDIKGIKYGAFESKEGFSIDEIKNNCDLFINGHLHNGNFLDDEERVLNLGILCGQNFSEDAFKYNHYVCILDTNKLDKLEFYTNPYALNFYKVEVSTLDEFKDYVKEMKDNAVVSVKCEQSIVTELKHYVESIDKILEYRIVSYRNNIEDISSGAKLNSVDYIQQFYDFIIDKLGNSKTVQSELSHIIEG